MTILPNNVTILNLNADSRDEIKEIDDKLNMEIMEVVMKNKDFEPTDAQKDAVKDAQKA